MIICIGAVVAGMVPITMATPTTDSVKHRANGTNTRARSRLKIINNKRNYRTTVSRRALMINQTGKPRGGWDKKTGKVSLINKLLSGKSHRRSSPIDAARAFAAILPP